MSNTAAEAVPATQPVVETPAVAAPAAEPTTQPKKFANIQKTVGSKAKAFLGAFHTAGEHIRGNINAALDGAGDAIAGRKTGTVAGRKSGEQVARSTEATTSAPVAPATTTAAPETNPTAETVPAAQETGENRFVVGQFINTSFKRTATLVHRVGGSLKSKGTSTVDSLGNSVSTGKQRASRRFSRAPKAAAGEAEAPVVTGAAAPAETAPAAAPAAVEPATTTA
ncbi:hypothetical protein PGTUg99_032809 [Puccinia graminis f. sp. tritici]|uniref:Uncharacterized protein n=1 Tax=Puccinia graminis f. sp. tritici TaxID=56615 RepID=A0A5B0SK96_PUCGR|nr:hypothetical protein PGTUg99_032809 [Puccinia graminis f. sp. tritici]